MGCKGSSRLAHLGSWLAAYHVCTSFWFALSDLSAAQAAGKASAPSTAEQRAAAELHGRLAALQRQRCQLHRELQELLADLCGGAAAPAPVASGAMDAFCSPRRRLAPLAPALLAARVAALGRLQDALLAACQALAMDFDAAQQHPPGVPPRREQKYMHPLHPRLVPCTLK